MRKLVTNHIAAGLRMHPNRQLVGHGARRAKQRRFHAEQSGRFFFERVDRRVVA